MRVVTDRILAGGDNRPPWFSTQCGATVITLATTPVREAALYLVFKIVERLSGNWRALNGGQNLMALVLEGWLFQNGIRHVPRKGGDSGFTVRYYRCLTN